ncbi:MAG: hypothetical protein DME11_00635 [Candidatus Rokuibacteriota bacterium]|nr:MAG: hypothetical protein DME11_00635 [Candidatus Rokubacteria bacterium]
MDLLLARAEFEAMDAAVGYHEGLASAAEVAAAEARFEQVAASVGRRRTLRTFLVFPSRRDMVAANFGH